MLGITSFVTEIRLLPTLTCAIGSPRYTCPKSNATSSLCCVSQHGPTSTRILIVILRRNRRILCTSLWDENNSSVGISIQYPSYASTYWDTYYFAKNLQGDIIAIYNSTGSLLVKYTYDPYGNVTSVTNASGTAIATTAANVANYNPFRYRGYHYDTDTGFYYLKTRYYDPELGRFINGDGYASTGQSVLGYNMFAYCDNNPIILNDSQGSIPSSARMLTDSGSAPSHNTIQDAIKYCETSKCQSFLNDGIYDIPGYKRSITVSEGRQNFSYVDGETAANKSLRILKYSGKLISKAASGLNNPELAGGASSVGTYVGVARMALIAYELWDDSTHPYQDDIPNGVYDEFIVTINGYEKSSIVGTSGKTTTNYTYVFVYYRTSNLVSGTRQTYCKEAYAYYGG